jgi:hypothetical protein
VSASSATPAASEPEKSEPAQPAKSVPGSLSRGRRITIWVLVILASILLLVGILTTWVKRQMLDNTAWNNATTQIIQDPQVQSALATYTVNQIYENINVGQALQAARSATRRSAPGAGDAGRQAPPHTASRAAGVPQGERGRSREARQRAREQDRPRHLHR